MSVKPVIHRQCPACDWWQVRAETDTGFIFTPCEAHSPESNFQPRSVLKADVMIRDKSVRALLDEFEVRTFDAIHPTRVRKCGFCNEDVQSYTPATRVVDSAGTVLLFHPRCVVPFAQRIIKAVT